MGNAFNGEGRGPTRWAASAVLIGALCGVLGVAEVASAEDYYVRVEAGASILAPSDIRGGGLTGEAKFDPGFEVGFAGGTRFVGHLRAELALSYREADVKEVKSGAVTLDGAGQVGTFATFVNAYYDLLPDAAINPFVGAGLGFAVIRVDSDAGANVLVVDDTSVEFAWNVLAGAEVPVGDRVALSVAYRYLGTTDPEFDATLVGVGRGTLDAEVTVHEVLFGATFRF